jgi:hypothetical protein
VGGCSGWGVECTSPNSQPPAGHVLLGPLHLLLLNTCRRNFLIPIGLVVLSVQPPVGVRQGIALARQGANPLWVVLYIMYPTPVVNATKCRTLLWQHCCEQTTNISNQRVGGDRCYPSLRRPVISGA